MIIYGTNGVVGMCIIDAKMEIVNNWIVFKSDELPLDVYIKIELTEESINDMRAVLASIDIPWEV